jgi:hypothetical protein
MNETHRGCRSPGGFFFAPLLTVANSVQQWFSVVGCGSAVSRRQRQIGGASARSILWGEALPSIRWFVTMQAPEDGGREC